MAFSMATGLLLYVAATSKFIWVLKPEWRLANQSSEFWFYIALICGELVIASILMGGFYSNRFRYFVGAIFCAFGYFQLIAEIQGVENCGCFGPVRFAPKYVMLFDFAVAGVFFGFYFWSSKDASRTAEVIATFGLITLSFCLLGIGVTITPRLTELTRDADLGTRQNTVTGETYQVLLPEQMVGKTIPFRDYVSNYTTLPSDGLLMLLSDECDVCERLARFATHQRNARIALIYVDQVPPVPPEHFPNELCTVGSLRQDITWVCRTPLIVVVENGIVDSVVELDGFRDFFNERWKKS